MLLTLCGCSLSSQINAVKVEMDDANVLHLALEKDIDSPDVQLSGCTEIADNIYSRLVKITKKGDGSAAITPDIAESWDVSADGKEYTFHLREDVLFSNGQEFEADDVLYTIDRMLDPETGALSNEAAEYILGAYDVMLKDKKSVENIGVYIIDKYTVKIELREAWAPFLASLCQASWSIYNRDAETAGAYCTGTGPYIFDDWKAGEYVFLTVNNDYYGGKAPVDGILYRIIPEFEEQLQLFTTGELDMIKVRDDAVADLYLNDAECSNYIVANKKADIWYYAMNQNIAPFTEKAVRLGMQRCIDRKAVLTSVFKGKGQVLNGLIPVGMQAYDQTAARIKYNSPEAFELFDEAGFSEGFSVNFCQTGKDETENAINEAVSEQLIAAGISASIKNMDEASYYSQLTGGTLPLHLCHVTCSLNEACELFSAFTPNGSARSSINCQNSGITKRCSDLMNISEISARIAEYQALEQTIVHEDAAIIPMFQIYSYELINPRVQGYEAGNNSVYGLSIEQ